MILTRLLLLVLFVIKTTFVYTQENDPWVLGIGINVVDNSGSRFDELLDIKDNWNLSRLLKTTVEKRFEYDYGIELSMSVNEFIRGKKINSISNSETVNYFAIDLMVKNYTSNYWQDPRHAWYTGYIIGGWGGNFFNSVINNTLNIGFGINIKLGLYMWLNFQTLGKFSIDNNTPGNANHLQHSISMVFWL
ncbi:hypothetical protein [Aquimarina algiphila]|uniref:hypothetical protein n=1 Tax=Aquimarina algiphila TaxID=2047982 RepID=UPI0024915172|nr:hypothetical protein [Aquimarina algiphila]